MSKARWYLLSKILINGGATAFFCCFIGINAFSQYANFTRPHIPDSSRGLISTIPWSSGAYGTAQERQRLLWWFNCGFYSFGLIAAGEAIKIYKLGDS